MSVSTNRVSDYKRMVKVNNFIELYVAIARDFGLTSTAIKFEAIKEIQDIENCVMHDVLEVRRRIVKEMKDRLKEILNEKEYKVMQEFL